LARTVAKNRKLLALDDAQRPLARHAGQEKLGSGENPPFFIQAGHARQHALAGL